MSARPKILLVDDEPNILEGLKRGLRSSFDVRTALSGAEGLAKLAEDPAVAVIMSDMRMPLMSGAVFLAKARLVAPDAVRMLLTGQSDVEDAILAINEGSIFRFLKKPCAPELLRSTLRVAYEQHCLVTAERTLLEQTLRGAVQALSDALALAQPGVFGMATRVKRCASAVAVRLQLKDVWQIEVAALLYQLGAVTLPPGVYERRARNDALLPSEQAMLERVPVVTDQLLAPIPRLEAVREIMREVRRNFSTRSEGEPSAVSRGASVLRVAMDFEELEAAGVSPTRALERMRARVGAYDPDVLSTLAGLHQTAPSVSEVPVLALTAGMIIASDVLTKSGQLLIARGHQVTPGLIGRLENFATSLARATVSVENDPS